MNSLVRRKNTDYPVYNDLIDDFFARPMRAIFNDALQDYNGLNPLRVKVKEEDDHYILRAEIPGLRKEDISLSFEDGLVTLKADWKEEREDQLRSGVYQWSRAFSDIDVDKSKATLENGMLRVELPKSEKSKPRKIEIK